MSKLCPSSHSVNSISANNIEQSSGDLTPTVADNSSSQTRISCERTVVTSQGSQVVTNLDSLKVNFWIVWNLQFLERLDNLKLVVQETEDESIPVDLAGFEFNLQRSGAKHFPFRLIRGDVAIMINRRKSDGNMPTMRLEIGSMSCWSPGFLLTYIDVLRMIDKVGGKIIGEKISEVHLAADLINHDINNFPFYKKDFWISNAHDFCPHFKHWKLTGISLGKGNIMLRVYDKVRELKKHSEKQKLFQKVWGLKNFDEKPVTRVEFQIRRPVLKNMKPQINELTVLTEVLNSVWHYCTHKWARLASTPVDRNHNQSRTETHPVWKFIQSIDWQGKMPVIREKKFSIKDLDVIRNIFRGTAMTFVASTGEEFAPDDIEAVIKSGKQLLESSIRDYASKKDFGEKMKQKINAARGPLNQISEKLNG